MHLACILLGIVKASGAGRVTVGPAAMGFGLSPCHSGVVSAILASDQLLVMALALYSQWASCLVSAARLCVS